MDSQAAIRTGELTVSVRVPLERFEGCTALMASKNDFDRHALDLFLYQFRTWLSAVLATTLSPGGEREMRKYHFGRCDASTVWTNLNGVAIDGFSSFEDRRVVIHALNDARRTRDVAVTVDLVQPIVALHLLTKLLNSFGGWSSGDDSQLSI